MASCPHSLPASDPAHPGLVEAINPGNEIYPAWEISERPTEEDSILQIRRGSGEVPGRTWCLGLLLVLFPESLWTGFRLVPQGRESGCRPWGPFQLAGQSFLSMMKLIFLWLTMQIRSIKLASGPGLSRCAWAVNLSANRSSSDSLIPLGEVTHGGSSGKTRMM